MKTRMSARVGLKAGLLAAALSCMLPAATMAMGFTGDFAPGYWTAYPDLGTVFFANGDTELHIVGPTDLATPQSSIDSIVYTGPGGLGVQTAGTLTFDFSWSFNSGAAITAQADFAWLNPPGPGSLIILASGPPGTTMNGTYVVPLEAGATFSFLLSGDYPNGKKTTAELVINNVNFQTSVPDTTSTLALLGISLALLALGRRWSRNRV